MTTFELFFDLVYVAATQVTGYMAHDHTGHGVVRPLVLMGCLFWWSVARTLGLYAVAATGDPFPIVAGSCSPTDASRCDKQGKAVSDGGKLRLLLRLTWSRRVGLNWVPSVRARSAAEWRTTDNSGQEGSLDVWRNRRFLHRPLTSNGGDRRRDSSLPTVKSPSTLLKGPAVEPQKEQRSAIGPPARTDVRQMLCSSRPAVSSLSAAIPYAASRRTAVPGSVTFLSRADVVPCKAATDLAKGCAWPDTEGVTGSNPVAPTT